VSQVPVGSFVVGVGSDSSPFPLGEGCGSILAAFSRKALHGCSSYCSVCCWCVETILAICVKVGWLQIYHNNALVGSFRNGWGIFILVPFIDFRFC